MPQNETVNKVMVICTLYYIHSNDPCNRSKEDIIVCCLLGVALIFQFFKMRVVRVFQVVIPLCVMYY